MPRVVDHEERRRHIVDAVFRLVGQRGLAGTGLRDVAAEAGVSMGAVQHYFSSKDEMLLFALEHMTERVVSRLPADPDQPDEPRAFVAAACHAMLPLNRPSREEAAVNIAFFAAALDNTGYQRLLRQGYRRLLAASAQRMRAAADAGRLRVGIDPDATASELFYLTQGLIGPLLIGATSKRDALTLVDRALDRAFRPVAE